MFCTEIKCKCFKLTTLQVTFYEFSKAHIEIEQEIKNMHLSEYTSH